jgi:hypothetical protein
MTVAVCPCCQRPLAERRLGGWYRDRIFELVSARPNGVSTLEIINVIYSHRADGGPTWANKAVHVMIYLMNKTLAKDGWRIRSTRGRGAVYRLERTS